MFKLVMGSGPVTITGNHYVEYLTVPEEDDDPDFVAEETDDETEISTFEDPEEIDESELKDLAEERAKPVDAGVNGSAAPSGGEGKRKSERSQSTPVSTAVRRQAGARENASAPLLRAKPVDAGVNGSAAPSGGEGKRKRA